MERALREHEARLGARCPRCGALLCVETDGRPYHPRCKMPDGSARDRDPATGEPCTLDPERWPGKPLKVS